MFNVGIVGGFRKPVLVKLTSRMVGYLQFPQVVFHADGRMDVSGLGFIAGEWFTQAPQANVGAQYQIRRTTQAGSNPLSDPYDMVTTAWLDITSPYGFRRLIWDEGINGRVLIEIRNKATQQVLASAQMWSHATYAP